MKITNRQWWYILIGAAVVVLLWYLSKQKGKSGQGATTDTGEETSSGDATLADPTENARISGATGTTDLVYGTPTRGTRIVPKSEVLRTTSQPGVQGGIKPIRKDVLI